MLIILKRIWNKYAIPYLWFISRTVKRSCICKKNKNMSAFPPMLPKKKKRYNCHSFTKDWPEMFYPSSARTPVSFFCLFARTVKEIVLVSNLMSQGCQQKKEKSYINVLLGFFWHSSFDVINNFFPGWERPWNPLFSP